MLYFMVSETLAAGALLRRARKGAGLSQQELAVRAGVTQSVISAYESGYRQPAVPTLAALVDAAGYELVMDLRQQPGRLSKLSGPVGRRGRRRREDRPDSDVDLLADLPAGLGLFGLARVQAELEAIIGAQVDLVPAQDLKPGVRARVDRELVAL